MTPRAEMTAALGAAATGALVALVAAGQPRTADGGAGPEGSAGGTPAAAALSLVVLAGLGAILLVRNRLRRVIGVVLFAASLGVVAAYALADDEGRSAAMLEPGQDVGAGWSALVWLGLVAGVLAAAGTAAVVVRAGRWPEPRPRYGGAAEAPAAPADAWEALDRGEDPTLRG